MINRVVTLPHKSFFLFGPRGVGKSTLLKEKVRADLVINLLKSSDFVALKQNPDLLLTMVKPLKAGAWVTIDEIQRVPELLNVVHELYESRHLNFALTGSSARKLRRGGANLLAGRVLQTHLYPFVYPEFQDLTTIADAVDWGTLPIIITEPEYRQDTLMTYVETYLREELIQEGIIRNTDSFMRFLNIAGLMNGQILNFENIARDAHVSRTTVQTYFQILVDTLIGFMLPSYQPHLRVKEVVKSKFYFFDSGIARGSANLVSYPLDSSYRGRLFETFMVNQVKAYNQYSKKHRNLSFYGISGGHEIDLIVELTKAQQAAKAEIVAIEFKTGDKWKREWCRPIADVADNIKFRIARQIGVYEGDRELAIGDMVIYPAEKFLQLLFAGEIF